MKRNTADATIYQIEKALRDVGAEKVPASDRATIERLIEELLRVSRRFVVMTFFDFYSLKNWLRRARRPFNKKPPKLTMKVERVRELAAANGARLVKYPMLAPTSSGHRYALMVKDQPANQR